MKTKFIIFLVALSVTLAVFTATKLVLTRQTAPPNATITSIPQVKPKFEVVINNVTNTPSPSVTPTKAGPTPVTKEIYKSITKDIDSMLDLTFNDVFTDMIEN